MNENLNERIAAEETARAIVPGTWPGGEPATVRAAAETVLTTGRAAYAGVAVDGNPVGRLVELADRFAEAADACEADGDVRASEVLDRVTVALVELRGAVADGTGVSGALNVVGKAMSAARTVFDADDTDELWRWFKRHLIEQYGAARSVDILTALLDLIRATGGTPPDEIVRVGLELLDTGRVEVVAEHLASRS